MLQIKHLNRYFGDNHVLKNIGLEIESHKTMAIIGPSGSGKFTLLQCTNLLETPDSGSISLDGKALDSSGKLPKHQKTVFTKKTGMVFQSSNLSPYKIALENIMERPVTVLKKSKDEARQGATELLKRVGLEGKKDSYSHQFSGGQQQGIAIARALTVKLEILLFDGLTSALNPELGAGALGLIKELSQEEYTIIVVTHNMSFVRKVSEEIIFVEKGETLARGSCDEPVNLYNDRISQFLSYLDQGGGKMDIKIIRNTICLGSLIIDISVRYDKILAMGEAVHTYEDYNVNPGGKDGNQSVAAIRSGGNVTLTGGIAAGEYTHQLIHNFQKDHIDTNQLKIDKGVKTGVAFVWADTEEHSKCVCSLGINARVTPQDVQSYARLFTDSNMVVTTLEHNSQLLEEISPMTRQNNCIPIVNSSSKGYSRLSPEITDRIDILKLDKVETKMLTGVRVETEKDAVQVIRILKERSIRVPAISLGSRGVVYECKGGVTYVKDLRVNAVDTAAAGDTFTGSTAAKLSQEHSFRESTDYANRAVVYCVQHREAQVSIPFGENVL